MTDEVNSTDNSSSNSEFTEIINKWKKGHDSPNYDPIPTMKRLSELIEEETVEFQKADPDPFDDRHPKAIIPGCGLGNLITIFTKEDDIINKIINSYLKHGYSVQNPSAVSIAAARLLLAVVPGVDVTVMNSSDQSVMELLFEWAEKSPEPLNIYSIGILAKALECQDINIKYSKSNLKMIKKILTDLSAMIFPNEENKLQSSMKVKTPRTKRRGSTPEHGGKKVPKVESEYLSSNTGTKEGTFKAIIRNLNTSGNSDKSEHYKLSTHDLCDNDISNSSWSEQMPFVIGSIYNLTPPLSDAIKQRFYLDFLKSVGEYQDYLPLFIENKVLDIVKYFINSSKPDGLLTFKALHFLGTLLCHNKIATEFINRHQGIEQLLSVQRPSLGSTGVSMCLYYLSYKTESMENVCQSFKSKLPLVKYAVWLLECSHESGRCHAALFFSLSFAFNQMLSLFDQLGGIRCLLNMISTSDAIQKDGNEDDDDDAESPSSRQTLKVVCPTLRKYFEAHLMSKVESLQSVIQDSKWKTIVGTVSSVKPSEASQEHIQECVEFVRRFDSVQDIRLKMICTEILDTWTGIDGFLKHKGVSLLLQVINIAVDWRVDLTGRLETLKAALGVLAIVTLSKKTQALLLKKGEFTSRREDQNATGIGLLLDIAEGKFSTGSSSQETDLQKLALEILVNCLYMPEMDEILEKVSKSNAILCTRNDKKLYEDAREIKHKLWKFVKQNDGIQIFLSLLLNKERQVTDEISILACKALYGLSHLQSVQQILTKLPTFNVSQLQVLIQETATHGKQKEQLLFRKAIDNLVQKVTGKPGSFEFDQNTYQKSLIVSKTQIRFDNKELLALIHSHLLWSGLTSTASLLKKEAQLSSSLLAKVFQICPKSTSQASATQNTTSLTSTTPTSSRISFSRGSHAQGATPLGSNNHTPSLPQTPATPTSSSLKKMLKTRLKNHVSSRFKLANNGKVTIAPVNANGVVKEEKFLPSLNTIVEQYLKHQHVSCRNPVVTVPEFTLSSKHYCPQRKHKVKSALNIAMRRFDKQYNPPCNGVGAQRWDRQFVFGRFCPSYTVKVPDERKINYTCSAFSANDEHLLIGDHKGGVTVHRLNTDQDDIIEGVGSGEIGSLQPNKYNDTLIVIYENIWNYHCALYSTANQFELKCTFANADYAEFSKVRQDKVIGTKNHRAMVYDANSNGKLLYSVQKQELACNYSWNRATFSYDDNLILSDGLLWDVRSSHDEPIHKFDKFSDFGDSLFHPDGTEVIINSQVWDIRTYHLLHTVPLFNQKRLYFNQNGTVIYSVKGNELDEERTSWSGANVSSFDAHDYTHLTTHEVKHDIMNFAADGRDCRLALIEKSTYEDSRSYDSAISNCRIYDIGMNKSEDYDDDEESDLEHETDSDDDSSNDDDDSDDESLNDSEFGSGQMELVDSISIHDSDGENNDDDNTSDDDDVDIHIMSGSDFDSSNFASGDSDIDF